MKLNRVIISVDHGRRIILYPEGGLNLEAYVNGPGWVLDNGAELPQGDFESLMGEVKKIVDNAAENAAVHAEY